MEDNIIPRLKSLRLDRARPWLSWLVFLLKEDRLDRLESLVTIFRFAGLTGQNSDKEEQIPSLLYITDPLQLSILHTVFNCIDVSKLIFSNILLGLEAGSFTLFLREEHVKADAVVLESLEYLCLLIVYLKAFLPILKDIRVDETVSKIIAKSLPPTSSTQLQQSKWYEAFTERNLRLISSKDLSQSGQQAPINVLINELLEWIRLNKPSESIQSPSKKIKELSVSYLTLLRFTPPINSLYIPTANLVVLGEHAADLSLSWFTPTFLSATLTLSRIYFDQPTDYTMGIAMRGCVALWTSWLKKISADDATFEAQLVTDIIGGLERILSDDHENSITVQEAIVGLAATTGKFLGTYDVTIGRIIASTLESSTLTVSFERINSSVAHFLHFTMKQSSIGILASAYLEYCSRRLSARNEPKIDEIVAILRLWQFVVGSWMEGENLLDTRVDEIIALLEKKERTAEQKIVSLMTIAGVLRAHQFPKKSKREISSRLPELEKKFLGILNDTVNAKADQIEVINNSMVYSTAQCLPNIALEKLLDDDLNLGALLSRLIEFLISSNYAFQRGLFLRPVTDEILHNGGLLTLDPKPLNFPVSARQLTAHINSPIFKEMSRISRAIARITEAVIVMDGCRSPIIANALEDLDAFSTNLLVEWNTCPLSCISPFKMASSSPSKIESTIMDPTDPYLSIQMIFKTFIFSLTMLFRSIIETATAVPYTVALNILNIYANLNFVIVVLGGGFSAYEEVLLAIVKVLTDSDEGQKSLEDWISKWMAKFVCFDQISSSLAYIPQIPSSPPYQATLLFLLNLSEQVVPKLSDDTLQNQILPILEPYILDNSNKDLFESAHAFVLALFRENREVIKEFAPWYSKSLLEIFPESLSIDQLRLAFTTMTVALVELDENLAWLVVQNIISKVESFPTIESMPSQSATLLPRNQFLMALIDQIRPISSLLVCGELLNQIGRFIVSEPNAFVRHAMLKIFFDAIGGGGINESRKTEVVKFALNLRERVEGMERKL